MGRSVVGEARQSSWEMRKMTPNGQRAGNGAFGSQVKALLGYLGDEKTNKEAAC